MMGLMAIGILSQGGGYSGPTEWIYPTAGVYEFIVPVSGTYSLELWGGGGGGGDVPTRHHAASGGGGAGQEYTITVTLQEGVTYTITVGSGGSVSGNGGTSSFGTLVSALGGQSGVVPTSNNQGGNGGRSYRRNSVDSFRSGGYGDGGTSAAGIDRSGGGGGASPDNSGGDALIEDEYNRLWAGYGRNNAGGGGGVSSDRDYTVNRGKSPNGGGDGATVKYRTSVVATNPTAPGGGGGGGARAATASYVAAASAGYAGRVKINLL